MFEVLIMAKHRPTVIDSVRGVKNDFKRLGVNLVATIKTARHSAGHLGFRDNVRNLRKNMGRDEMGPVEQIRKRFTSQESSIPRPGVFIDDEGNMKFPVLNKIKEFTEKDENESGEGVADNASNNSNNNNSNGDGDQIGNLGLQGPESSESLITNHKPKKGESSLLGYY